MGRRAGRRRPTRLEKIAAAKKSGKTIVAVGHRKPGQAEVLRPDFKSISSKTLFNRCKNGAIQKMEKQAGRS